MENQPTENNNNFQPTQGSAPNSNINPQPIFSSPDISTPTPTPTPMPPQKPKTNLIVIIAFVVLAVAAVGLGVFALVQSNNQSGTSNNPEAPNTPTQPDKEKEEDTPSEDQPENPSEDAPQDDEELEKILKNIEAEAETNNQKYGSVYDLLKKYATNYTLPYGCTSSIMNIFLKKDSAEFEKYKYMLTMESGWWKNKYIRGLKEGKVWEDIGTSYTYDDIQNGKAPYQAIEYNVSYDEINTEYHKLFSTDTDAQVSHDFICGCLHYNDEYKKYISNIDCGNGIGCWGSSYYFITDSKEQNNQLIVQVAHAYIDVDNYDTEEKTSLKLNLNNTTVDISSSQDFYNTYSGQLPRYQFTFTKENGNYVLSDFAKI